MVLSFMQEMKALSFLRKKKELTAFSAVVACLELPEGKLCILVLKLKYQIADGSTLYLLTDY